MQHATSSELTEGKGGSPSLFCPPIVEYEKECLSNSGHFFKRETYSILAPRHYMYCYYFI